MPETKSEKNLRKLPSVLISNTAKFLAPVDLIKFSLTCKYFNESIEKSVTKIKVTNKNLTDSDLEAMAKKYSGLKELDLSECRNITDTGLAHLSPLTNLQTLYLEATNISNTGLQSLAGLTSLQTLDLSWCRNITDQGLQSLSPLTNLQTLNLNGANITDTGLQYLPKSLQTLNLRECSNITDAGLQYLPKSLQTLNLRRTNITDAGLQSLAGLTNLQTLELYGCSNITDAGLQSLAGLTSLQTLNLAMCSNITGTGLQSLAGLTSLQTLNLFDSKMTGAGLAHLSAPHSLQTLNLFWCRNITDAGLQSLAGLTNLQTLNLHFCWRITDAGLQYLPKSLQTLNLRRTNITDAGLQSLAGLTNLQTLNLKETNIDRKAKATLLAKNTKLRIDSDDPNDIHFIFRDAEIKALEENHEKLLETMADVNAKDSDGNTLLDIAIKRDQTKLAEMLIAKGIYKSKLENIKKTNGKQEKYLLELPKDLIFKTSEFLAPVDLIKFSLTSKYSNKLIKEYIPKIKVTNKNLL